MRMRNYIALFTAVLAGGLVSCQKQVNIAYLPTDSAIAGRIQFVLQYNPAQDSLFYATLQIAGLADTLSTPGPFTVFAPTNAAEQNALYFDNPANYLLSGIYDLHDIPPGQTKVLTTAQGYKIFVTSYDGGTDTNFTANGSLVLTSDQHAANGLVQVLSRAMYPIYYPTCLKYINDNQNLSVFAYAIKRSRLDLLLNDSTQAYTVLAPDNYACGQAGINLDVVASADPDSLAEHFVKNHILSGRQFLYDFLRQFRQGMGDPQTILVTTLNGAEIQVIISSQGLSNPTAYPVQFAGNNNSNPASIQFYNPFDVPAGVGTVDEIDGVIMP